jgi:CheY-like chemotaxis protein
MLDQILCVDDDAITLMLCKKVIERASFSAEIITANNGEEALALFHKLKNQHSAKKPQLIFLDLNMPIMGGWEFLDNFTSAEYEEFNHIGIIVLSSTINPEDLIKAKKYPVVIDFLSKPISKNMLEYLKEKFEI